MIHDNWNCINLLLLNHSIKNNHLHDVKELNTKKLYSLSIFFKKTKRTLQKYLQDYFSGVQLVRNDIYSFPRMVSIDPEPRHFQFKMLHTVLYLNKNIFIFGKTGTKLWSFCNLEDETALHLFANCTKSNIFWANITSFSMEIWNLLQWLHSAMHGFSDVDQDIVLLLLLLLLLLLFCYY